MGSDRKSKEKKKKSRKRSSSSDSEGFNFLLFFSFYTYRNSFYLSTFIYFFVMVNEQMKEEARSIEVIGKRKGRRRNLTSIVLIKVTFFPFLCFIFFLVRVFYELRFSFIFRIYDFFSFFWDKWVQIIVNQ